LDERPKSPVFALRFRADAAHSPSNIRQRVLAPAVDRANERLEERGEAPLPEPLTPHKLRHTFASLLVALGTDPGATMDQVGHTDPALTLRVYTHGMRRDAAAKRALRELVGLPAEPLFGQQWAVDPIQTRSRSTRGWLGAQKSPA
jgi:integrase